MELSYLELPPTKEKQLIDKRLESIEDILNFLPKDYYDFTNPYPIRQSVPVGFHENIAIIGRLIKVTNTRKTVIATIKDNTAMINIVFFNQKYMFSELISHVNEDVIVCGKISVNKYNKQYQIASSLFISTNIEKYKKLVPRYVKIKGMSVEYFSNIMSECIEFLPLLDDYDEELINKFNIYDRKTCYKEIHNPESKETLELARKRLIFDKLFWFLWLSREKEEEFSEDTNVRLKNINLEEKLFHLPFPLTGDQEKTVRNILKKMYNNKRVSGLIQGDVGCGKTIVAFLLMFIFADNNYQSILVAPTQTLANQHYEDILEYSNLFGYNVGFLTGSTKAKEKRKTRINESPQYLT